MTKGPAHAESKVGWVMEPRTVGDALQDLRSRPIPQSRPPHPRWALFSKGDRMNTKVRHQEGKGRLSTKLGLSLLVLALIGVAVGVGTWSAFSATTQNSGNSFSAGTVILSDDDSGSAMLSLANAKPGDSDTSCIVVTYTGSLAATVRLYGTTTGTGLDQYLDM